MPYKLKHISPDIECCDGPFSGRKFLSGKVYDEIPPEESQRFDEVVLGPSGYDVVPAPPPSGDEPILVPPMGEPEDDNLEP